MTHNDSAATMLVLYSLPLDDATPNFIPDCNSYVFRLLNELSFLKKLCSQFTLSHLCNGHGARIMRLLRISGTVVARS